MSFALELRGISKRFVVGSAGCSGSVHALRGVDLELHPGDAMCIVGAPGSGKSTLLLCAAGLLRPDAGIVRWFGSGDREAALRRTSYHFAGPSAGHKRQTPGSPHIYLLDGGNSASLAADARVARWIERRTERGDVVLVSSRGGDSIRELVPRTLVLRDGRVHSVTNPSVPARVAESFAGRD